MRKAGKLLAGVRHRGAFGVERGLELATDNGPESRDDETNESHWG